MERKKHSVKTFLLVGVTLLAGKGWVPGVDSVTLSWGSVVVFTEPEKFRQIFIMDKILQQKDIDLVPKNIFLYLFIT
jgi:hypothetical protein